MFDIVKDIQKTIKKYPSLSYHKEDKNIVVEGTFTAHNSNIEIETYKIKIQFPDAYPFAFPYIYEVGDKIFPKNEIRHVNPDGSLCLANPFDQVRICRKGITLLFFLDKILNPHLCREFAREQLGYYPTGERSHGWEGLWESFYEILDTKNKSQILKEIYEILHHPKVSRNTLCYCNSGKKYKECHEKKANEILIIGKKKLEQFYSLLKDNL